MAKVKEQVKFNPSWSEVKRLGRTKHAIGASRHTQLAGRAVLGKVLGGECSGRQDGGLTLGHLLVK